MSICINRPTAILILVSALVLGGCATAQQVGESWMGLTETQLLTSWGAPTRTATSGSKTIHTWERRNGYGQVTCQQTMVVSNGVVSGHSSNCGIGFID